jgi:two-component system, LytTR family, response regulator
MIFYLQKQTAMYTTKNFNNTLLLPVCNGLEVIDISTIIRIEAISNYSKLYFTNGKTLVVAKVLRWFEERLKNNEENKTIFLRTHRTHLVNKNFISRYANGKIELHNHQIIEVARRKKNDFLLQWYCNAA